MAGLNTRTGQRNVNYVPKIKPQEERGRSTIIARSESPRATNFVPGQMTEQFANRNTPQSQPNSFDAYSWLSQQNQQQANQAMQSAINGYQQTSQITLGNQQNMERFRNNEQRFDTQTQRAYDLFDKPSSGSNNYMGFDTMMGGTRTSTFSTAIPGQLTPQQAQLEMARMQFEQGQHRNAIDRQNEDARNRANVQQAQIGADASMFSSMLGSLNNQAFRYW